MFLFPFAVIPVRAEMLAVVAGAGSSSSPLYTPMGRGKPSHLCFLLLSEPGSHLLLLLSPPPHTPGCQSCPPPITAGLGRASQLWSVSSHHGQHLLLLSAGIPFPCHQWGAQHCLGTWGQFYIIKKEYKSPSTVAMC